MNLVRVASLVSYLSANIEKLKISISTSPGNAHIVGVIHGLEIPIFRFVCVDVFYINLTVYRPGYGDADYINPSKLGTWVNCKIYLDDLLVYQAANVNYVVFNEASSTALVKLSIGVDEFTIPTTEIEQDKRIIIISK